MKQVTLSPYRITWVEIRPVSGHKVTMADAKKMTWVNIHRNGYGYIHFANRDKAVEWLTAQANKSYSKRYEARLFTDKQFGMAKEENGYAIPFTAKQFNEVYNF